MASTQLQDCQVATQAIDFAPDHVIGENLLDADDFSATVRSHTYLAPTRPDANKQLNAV